MGKPRIREFQCGEWWIGAKPGRPGYFRCKLQGRQVVRISLGTGDLEEAKEYLTAWFFAQQQGAPPGGPSRSPRYCWPTRRLTGRVQTNKRRAEVPICDALAARLREWGEEDGWDGSVIRFRGKPVASVKKSWRSARAGIGVEDCNPYSLRHTVAKWLRSQSVPPWEVAALLGHKMPGYTITEMYAGADPSHMKATKAALDKLLPAAPIG